MFNAKSTLNIKKERIETLLEGVSMGLPIRIACERAYIPQYYYYTWLKVYNEYISKCEENNITDKDIQELDSKEYLDSNNNVCGHYYTPISLIHEIKKRNAEFIANTHKQVQAGIKDQWQSAAWLLERRCKNEYGKDEQTDDKKQVQAVKVTFVDPKQDKKRMDALLKEVEENVGSGK